MTQSELAKLQQSVSNMVMGTRHAIKTAEAVQPRADMGIGMVSVADQMAATCGRSPCSPRWGPTRTPAHTRIFFSPQPRARRHTK